MGCGRGRLIKGLRKMGDKAPTRAKAYRQHLKSMLGKDAKDGAVEAAAAALAKRGVATIDGSAVKYNFTSPSSAQASWLRNDNEVATLGEGDADLLRRHGIGWHVSALLRQVPRAGPGAVARVGAAAASANALPLA